MGEKREREKSKDGNFDTYNRRKSRSISDSIRLWSR
jgi:hypothetical protein